MNYSVNQKEELVFKCDMCHKEHIIEKNEVMSSFDSTNSDEREMGIEIEHLATISIQCNCGNEIEINISVWEYPEGCHNDESDSIDVENGKLISCFPLELPEN